MTHLTSKRVHRYVGDPLDIRAKIQGLTAGQVSVASWASGSLAKTLGDGVTVEDEDGVAVLVVSISADDTTSLGADIHRWHLTAGSDPAPVVAIGELELTPRPGAST